MYENLIEYFENTPKEKIIKDWEDTKKYDKILPTIDDFLKNNLNQIFINNSETIIDYSI